MPTKSNYLISAVCYNAERSKITHLRVHNDLGDKIGPSFVQTRDQVIRSIEGYNIYCTIFQRQDGYWEKGANVNVVQTVYGKYLRTDKNNTPKDNLGNLPEFTLSYSYNYR